MKTQNIQDIYELSAIQHGILFHCLYAPESEFYLVQTTFALRGELNLIAFDRAWQQVVARHASLRTSFYWEDINKPLQVVHKQVKIPIEQQDWRGFDPVEQQKLLESFLERDRQQGFDLSQECLMRITLLRLTAHSYKFILTGHFINADGWSSSIIINNFLQLYEAFCQAKEVSLAAATPFRKYITWLQRQDLSKGKVFWQQALKGLKAPTILANLYANNFSSQVKTHDHQRIFLSEIKTAALMSFTRQHQITLNTLILGAWAWLLSRYSGEKKVVYGCTTFGRPVDIVGIDSMVGNMVNSLPVWVEVDDQQLLLPWLKQFQQQLLEMRQYEYVPLVEIQECTEIPQNVPLFESLVVFEKLPLSSQWSTLKSYEGLEMEVADIWYKTNYPLNIVVYPSDKLILEIAHHCHLFDAATVTGMLQHLETLLQGMVANPEVRLKDLSLLTPTQQQFRLMLEKEATFDFDFALCS
ncbi:MAG: non-ribosomal peptide synthetase [Symploca sp. SIO3C6]|nr:non-ribosomal peptide synthetase [Symploca sp. SIO3C6]